MQMKIVILDGYTANPGDLSWSDLEQLGQLTVYDRTRPEETVARAADADVVLTNKVVMGRQEIVQLPRLKYIGVLATGYNVVDIQAARERGIIVTNVPAYSTESVAQMVFAHLLTVTNRTEHYAVLNRQGRWSSNPDFSYWDTPLHELAGKTFGIVGLGNIGSGGCTHQQERPAGWHPKGVARRTADRLRCRFAALSAHRHHPPSHQCPDVADDETLGHPHQYRSRTLGQRCRCGRGIEHPAPLCLLCRRADHRTAAG